MDIVELLRGYNIAEEYTQVMHEAADEIENLRQQRDELVEAVKAALSDDQPYISKCKDALAKLCADKTGETT